MQSCPGLTGHARLGHTSQALPEGRLRRAEQGAFCSCRLHAHGLPTKFSSSISEFRQVNRWADLVLLTLMLMFFSSYSFQKLLYCSAYTLPNGCNSPVKVPAPLCFVHRGADLNIFYPLTEYSKGKAFFFFFSNLSSQRDTC